MKVGWQFKRGLMPADGSEVPIQCSFTVEGDGAATAVTFIVPESAAVELIEDIRKVASPLTVTGNGSGP